MNVQYLGLDDLLVIASRVLCIEAEVLDKTANLVMGDSALNAPAASFGSVEFYPAIAKTENMDTIHELALSLEKEMPTFYQFYTQEHLWAVRDQGGMNPTLLAPLMKAGFRHAVAELERELHPQRE